MNSVANMVSKMAFVEYVIDAASLDIPSTFPALFLILALGVIVCPCCCNYVLTKDTPDILDSTFNPLLDNSMDWQLKILAKGERRHDKAA